MFRSDVCMYVHKVLLSVFQYELNVINNLERDVTAIFITVVRNEVYSKC